jgi:beta-glucosidase
MGGGSAKVIPHYRMSLIEAFRQRLGDDVTVTYESGDGENGIEKAVASARRADVTVVVVGTGEEVEGEGVDRTTMDLPGRQDDLVRRVLELSGRTVVVVASGAPVTMAWASQCPALIQSFFGGQEMAHGLVDVLMGDADAGGRLPTTLPPQLEQTPAHGNFPGEASHIRYGEGLFVGYRWYEARGLPVTFPFGHGLSYTSFDIGTPVGRPCARPNGCRMAARSGSRCRYAMSALVPAPRKCNAMCRRQPVVRGARDLPVVYRPLFSQYRASR